MGRGDAVVRVGTALLGVALTAAVLRALRRRRRTWVRAGRYEDREAVCQIIVDQDRTLVYWLCREPERLAAVLGAQVRAETIDETWSRWSVPEPDGLQRLLSVEIIGDIPELLLAWRVANGWLPHEGTIRFMAAGPHQTELSVSIRYRWSARRAAESGISEDPVDRLLGLALVAVRDAALHSFR